MSTHAQDCMTMAEVRAGIDTIDRAIVALLAERMGFIARAGELKTDRDTVHDDWRIEDVVTKVKAEAEQLGLDPDVAEAVYRLLISRSIAYEFTVFDAKAR